MTDKKFELPEGVKDFLTIFKIMDFPAVLAGGALRDFDTGRTAKDWDVFVELPDKLKTKDQSKDCIKFNYKIDKLMTLLGLDYEEMEDEAGYTISVSNTVYKGVEIQIIFCPNVKEHLKTFSCNASEVKYSLEKDRLIRSERYMKFLECRQLIFKDTVSDDYIERIKSYYPNYSWLECKSPW